MKAILYFVLAVLMGGQLTLHSANGLAYKSWDPVHKFSSHDRDVLHHHDSVASIDFGTTSTEISLHHTHDSVEDPDLASPFGMLNTQTKGKFFVESRPKNNFDNLFGRLLRPPRTFS